MGLAHCFSRWSQEEFARWRGNVGSIMYGMNQTAVNVLRRLIYATKYRWRLSFFHSHSHPHWSTVNGLTPPAPRGIEIQSGLVMQFCSRKTWHAYPIAKRDCTAYLGLGDWGLARLLGHARRWRSSVRVFTDNILLKLVNWHWFFICLFIKFDW